MDSNSNEIEEPRRVVFSSTLEKLTLSTDANVSNPDEIFGSSMSDNRPVGGGAVRQHKKKMKKYLKTMVVSKRKNQHPMKVDVTNDQVDLTCHEKVISSSNSPSSPVSNSPKASTPKAQPGEHLATFEDWEVVRKSITTEVETVFNKVYDFRQRYDQVTEEFKSLEIQQDSQRNHPRPVSEEEESDILRQSEQLSQMSHQLIITHISLNNEWKSLIRDVNTVQAKLTNIKQQLEAWKVDLEDEQLQELMNQLQI